MTLQISTRNRTVSVEESWEDNCYGEEKRGHASSPNPRLQARHPEEAKNANSFLSSVVKIYNYYTPPNISMPWQMKRQSTSTSSGFVIKGRRLICNAHGVRYYSTVRVRKPGDATKYTAKVLAVGHECDLALVTVDDEEFWKDLRPLKFGPVPPLQSEVVVIGYPTGGDNISVTKGIVSRVDVTQYSHVGESLLAIQIDASINEGNSGGPTIMGDRVVGVAFETLTEAENIGYIIPVPIILHFLEDLKRHNEYTGFCLANPIWQDIQNKSFKKYLKMKEDQHGVLIAAMSPLMQSFKVLKKHDVIMAFDGKQIADDGTIMYREGERVAFSHLLASKFVGDTAKLTILRSGEVLDFEVPMERRTDLVPLHLFDRQPTYFVYVGLVFVAMTRHWLISEYGSDWPVKAPIALCDLALTAFPKKEGEEVIVLSQVIVSEVTFGYQNLTNLRVGALNGTPLLNVKHLVDLVENSTEEFLRFDLGRFTTIVLEREKCNEMSQQILVDNQIGKSKSLPAISKHTAPMDGKPIVTENYCPNYEGYDRLSGLNITKSKSMS